MADDAQDVGQEITLDDFNADEKQDSPKESSPKEAPKAETKPEVAKSEETEAKTEPPADKPETEGEKEDVADDTDEPSPAETESKPQGKAEERKAQLNTEIRDLVAQKNALKAEVEKANAETYQVATVDELTEQGMTELEAKVEAMRQQTEMERYNNQVADAQLTLSSESQRVLEDFPIFNPESKDFDKELAEEASQLLEANLITDQNTGQIIGSNVSPYQLYKTLARASGISAVRGELKGQQNTEKQLANVDANSSAAPEKKPSDPLMDLWKSDD